MRHEKIIKRPDGSKVKIKVEVVADFIRMAPDWSFFVYLLEKGKRNWNPACDAGSYAFRRLSSDERAQKLRDDSMQHVTAQEVEAAMLELWEQLKPTAAIVSACQCRS